jgi:hypothetical protein
MASSSSVIFTSVQFVAGPNNTNALVFFGPDGKSDIVSFSGPIYRFDKTISIRFSNVLVCDEKLGFIVSSSPASNHKCAIWVLTILRLNDMKELFGSDEMVQSMWLSFQYTLATIPEDEKRMQALLQSESIRKSMLSNDKQDLETLAGMLLANIKSFQVK